MTGPYFGVCSYGPCQFPTLGLIVQRWWEIQAHIPEHFWYIQVGAGWQAVDRLVAGGLLRLGRRVHEGSVVVLAAGCCMHGSLEAVAARAAGEHKR